MSDSKRRKMDPPDSEPASADPEATAVCEPAFTAGGRSISDFAAETVLRFDGGGRLAVVRGQLSNKPGLLTLELKAACADSSALLARLPTMKLELNNHSGAEYSFYDASMDGANYSAEMIWPATERQIARKTPAEQVLAEETASVYAAVVEPFVAAQASKIGWIDAVCSLEKERERNLFVNERFVINVDTKWTTHGPLSEDPAVRATWKGAPNTTDLYLLAISKDSSLRSLRDLRGEEGAALCDEMKSELRKAAWQTYGVVPGKLRIFFHYHPQFYRLHAHCTRAEHIAPGCETDRAHLLTTVSENLRIDGSFYSERATLSFKVKVHEKLYGVLEAAGALI